MPCKFPKVMRYNKMFSHINAFILGADILTTAVWSRIRKMRISHEEDGHVGA
ncbi:MAG: hypothetical protein NC206_06505 [Bacteroides sp.]|nr:hypothetical protein [Roseburia sp.]MCM1346720.1 hypothetical protein [Bacteroides sp.]